VVAYLRAGYDVDIGVGLRLPVKITLEYPEQMTVEHDYEFYATLTPLDWPDYDEFLCRFKAQLWVEAGIFNPFAWKWERYSARWGPNYDWSRSFTTPLGPAIEFPLPPIETTVFDSAWVIGFSLLKVKLVIDPQLGSDKITAKVRASGDAAGEHTLVWSEPDQTIPFVIHADDYGPTDFAEIELSDLRYYFSIFMLHFGLKFDFHSWIDGLTGDPTIGLFTLDMSGLTEGLYLGVHAGTDGTIDLRVFVVRGLPLNDLEGAKLRIANLQEYTFFLYENSKINQYKHDRIIGDLAQTKDNINNAIVYLDTARNGFDDKVEGLSSLLFAVKRLENLINDIQNWNDKRLMPSDIANNLVGELERIQMKLVNRVKEEALSEKLLAVAATEDAEARGRYAPWLCDQVAYIDQYLADAEYWLDEGWPWKAVYYYKAAFWKSQKTVCQAYDWSWDIDIKDWVDQLEQNP